MSKAKTRCPGRRAGFLDRHPRRGDRGSRQGCRSGDDRGRSDAVGTRFRYILSSWLLDCLAWWLAERLLVSDAGGATTEAGTLRGWRYVISMPTTKRSGGRYMTAATEIMLDAGAEPLSRNWKSTSKPSLHPDPLTDPEAGIWYQPTIRCTVGTVWDEVYDNREGTP